MKKGITATRSNIGLLLDRSRKFLKRNSGKTIVMKSVWGKPLRDETWDRNPRNFTYTVAPKIEKHWHFDEGDCLLGVFLQSNMDYKHICGEDASLRDFDTYRYASHLLYNGDEVFFKDDGIMVISKEPVPSINKRLTWFLTAV